MPAWPHAWTSRTLSLPSPMLQVRDQEAELAEAEAEQAFSRHALSMDLRFLPSGRQGLVVGREATIKARPGTLSLSPPQLLSRLGEPLSWLSPRLGSAPPSQLLESNGDHGDQQ